VLFNAIRELKFAARSLSKRPGYSAAAIVTLALGIGANVAIFTVINAVLLRPLPYPEADRIVMIRHHAPGINFPELQSSPGLIDHYRESARTITGVAGYEVRAFNLAGNGAPDRVRAIAVTPGLFETMAVRPILGRSFVDGDAQEKSARVTILSHQVWQSRFGADPTVVGRSMQLDGQRTEIVGVMPREFVFPDADTRLFIPLWLDPKRGFGTFGTRTLARLAPGVTLEAAQLEIDALQQRIPERFPDLTKETLERFRWSATISRLRDIVIRDIATPLWLLFGSVSLVLLIAGVNVANLFLVRSESRQREIVVRAALGGSRLRVAGSFVAESMVLALVGGALGLLLATFGVDLLVAYGPAQLPRLHEIGVDPTSAAFAAAISVFAGVALGVVAVPSLTRRSFAQILRDGGRGNTAGRQRHQVRQVLIASEVAMAVVLLVGSGLMLRTIARLSAVDPGFKVEGLLTAGVSLGTTPDQARLVAFYDRVLKEVAGMPGVISVGAANSLPIEAAGMNGSSFAIESRPQGPNDVPPVTMYQVVTPGYFETLGVAVREGRLPDWRDMSPGRAVVWVSESFARQFLDNRAVGERIQIDEQWLEIVGVVSDVRTFGLREDIRPLAYLPLGTPVRAVTREVMLLVIRTGGDPASLASDLRSTLDRVDASVPLTRIRTMEDIVARSLAQTSFTMVMLVIAAGVALVLGVVGLYGVISFVVSQRVPELGVRLALGAQPGQLQRMVLRQGMTVALVGIVVGVGLAAVVARTMQSIVFGISTRDPITFVLVVVALAAVSAIATYFPARRAAAVDPLEALRQEG
jgi:predicted permease